MTRSEFEGFMGYQPSDFSGCSTCPVESLSWHEAAAFTNAVSGQAGLDRCYDCSGSEDAVECELDSAWPSPCDCPGYRLPTEAEWEYAARAGTTGAYSNGGHVVSDADENDCDGNLVLDNGQDLDDFAWYCGNSEDEPHPVGELEAGPWGLYDVHGNVWERCQDWFEDYGEDSTDPWGPASGSSPLKRGGSWSSIARNLRVANRGTDDTADYDCNLGFRLACSK